MRFVDMLSKENPIRLKMLCLDTMVQMYALMMPNILHLEEAVAKARTATLEQWPRQMLCELVPMLLKCTQLLDLLRECDVSLLYRFLITPVVSDVCLIPNHEVLFDTCDFQIKLDLVPSDSKKSLVDPVVVLQDLISVGNSKLTRLHIQGVPKNMCEIVANLPNLESLWIEKEEKGGEKEEAERLESCMSYLESEARIEEIHLVGLSISFNVISMITKMKQLKVLDIRSCELSAKAAATLVWELPNVIEFGWWRAKEHSEVALLELCEAVKELDESNQCLRKLKKWIGIVGIDYLVDCDPIMFELLDDNCRGLVSPTFKVPEHQSSRTDFQQFFNLIMTGNFGIVSHILSSLTNDSSLKQIFVFNGHIITELSISKGAVSLNVLCLIPHLCQNLNLLEISLKCTNENGSSKESVDTSQSSSGMPRLHTFYFQVEHEGSLPTELTSAEEKGCLKKLLCSCPNVTTIFIDIGKIPLNDEKFLALLPSKMNYLEHFLVQGWNLELTNISVIKLQEIAPSLNTIKHC